MVSTRTRTRRTAERMGNHCRAAPCAHYTTESLLNVHKRLVASEDDKSRLWVTPLPTWSVTFWLSSWE